MYLWLHDLGYTLFTVNDLTYAEINMLVRAWNRREKKKEQAMKKAKSKGRR